MKNINALDNEGRKIRYKVVLALFTINKDLFNPRTFDDVPLELMPYLLEIVQQDVGYRGFGKGVVKSTNKHRANGLDPTLNRLYAVVTGWNTPLLVLVSKCTTTMKMLSCPCTHTDICSCPTERARKATEEAQTQDIRRRRRMDSTQPWIRILNNSSRRGVAYGYATAPFIPPASARTVLI
jgi:hypothetical protein